MKKLLETATCLVGVFLISSCQSVDFEKLGTEREKEEKVYSTVDKEQSDSKYSLTFSYTE